MSKLYADVGQFESCGTWAVDFDSTLAAMPVWVWGRYVEGPEKQSPQQCWLCFSPTQRRLYLYHVFVYEMILGAFLLTVILPLVHSDFSNGCPSEKWVQSNITLLCLGQIQGTMTHPECVCACAQLQASVACVRSSEANQELTTPGAYIGYVQRTNESNAPWHWVSGCESSYVNWHPGEPTGQPFVAYYPFETSPTWYDVGPDVDLLWAPSSCLCEYDLLQPGAKISTSYAQTYIPSGSCQSWKDFSDTVLANWQPTFTTIPASAASQMAMAMTILCWTLFHLDLSIWRLNSQQRSAMWIRWIFGDAFGDGYLGGCNIMRMMRSDGFNEDTLWYIVEAILLHFIILYSLMQWLLTTISFFLIVDVWYLLIFADYWWWLMGTIPQEIGDSSAESRCGMRTFRGFRTMGATLKVCETKEPPELWWF